MKKKLLTFLIAVSMVVCSMPFIAAADTAQDPEAAYQHVMNLSSDAEREAYLNSLSEEEQKALEAYAQKLAEQEADKTVKTVDFTDAGPFLPAVDVSLSSVASAKASPIKKAGKTADDAEETRKDTEGLETRKTVTENKDGTYTLKLESYVTGKTTTTTVEKPIPVDIVLVLDQSGSMQYGFDGNSATYANSRQKAMQNAVTNFIGEVAKKQSDQCDNRISIVTFGSNASTLQGWTTVDASGNTALEDAISGLPQRPEGATNVAAGMTQAENLLGSGYSYSGENTQRQKVVIVFTDGVPTTATDFNTTVATNAIQSAKRLKDAGTTVYSVGIFNGADPNQLYGEKFDYAVFPDVMCSGDVGSIWGASAVREFFGGNDFRDIDLPACNRFLNYLSTNFKNANEIGIKSGTYNPGNRWFGAGSGYEITKNFERDASNYYLTASDTAGLNSIFQSISSQIQSGSATVSLGSSTVVKDVIADSFELPANASDKITVKTAAYQSDGSFADPVDTNLTPTIDGKTVSVKGFDFSANYCDKSKGRQDAENPDKPGNFYGKKLIIEIPIQVRDGFLGGNGVPTNTSGSGIYDGDSRLMEQFEVPTADVSIPDLTAAASAADYNVYLYGGLKSADLKGGASVKAGNVKIDLDPSAVNYGLEPWQNAFVNINVTDPGNKTELTDDTDYSVGVTIESKTKGDASSKSAKISGKISVFKPSVTFRDSELNYGDTPDYDKQNLAAVEWKHGSQKDSDVTMTGEKPTLTYTCQPQAAPLTKETSVRAQSAIGTKDVTRWTRFFRRCDLTGYSDEDDAWHGKAVEVTDGEPNFVVHLRTFTLTIEKKGAEKIDENQSFIFHVTGERTKYAADVVVHGNGTATVAGLPVDTYTVTEEKGWSWRYSPAEASQTLQRDRVSGKETLTFTNKRAKLTWLNGSSWCENNWKNGTSTKSGSSAAGN